MISKLILYGQNNVDIMYIVYIYILYVCGRAVMVRHKYVKSLLSGIKSPWVLQISAMQGENSSSVSQNVSTPSPVVIPGPFAKMCPHIIGTLVMLVALRRNSSFGSRIFQQ